MRCRACPAAFEVSRPGSDRFADVTCPMCGAEVRGLRWFERALGEVEQMRRAAREVA